MAGIPASWRRGGWGRVAVLVVTGVSLLAVSPVLLRVYRSAGDTFRLAPGWLAAMALATVLHFVANWELHRIVLRTPRWFDVAAAQLVGNAASHVMPAGTAMGAGVQMRLLTTAGFPMAETVTALTAVTVLGTAAGFVVLPLGVLAAAAAGSNVDHRLTSAMWVGSGVLLLVLVAAVLAVGRDGVWRRVATVIVWARHRARRHPDGAQLGDRLLEERDLIRAALRDRVPMLALVVIGRSTGDYVTLYFALRAVGAHVNPAAILAAFIVSNIAGMIPFTPSGLGFVEASLTGVLGAAGATVGQANLAVATYRLAASWLPCLAGVVALVWFQRRHHNRFES